MGMTRIKVSHAFPVPGPPHDAATRINPFGWHHFWTTFGEAWVWPYPPQEGQPDAFMLYHLQSEQPGHGRAIMEAIGEWADRERRKGILICNENVVGFYVKFGWYSIGNWGLDHMYEMARDAGV